MLYFIIVAVLCSIAGFLTNELLWRCFRKVFMRRMDAVELMIKVAQDDMVIRERRLRRILRRASWHQAEVRSHIIKIAELDKETLDPW